MRGFLSTSVLLWNLVVLGASAIAAPGPEPTPLESDRGPLGEALGTPVPGATVIEGGALGRLAGGRSPTNARELIPDWQFPELLLRFGLPAGLEARLGIPSLGSVTSGAVVGQASFSSIFWTPVALGAKWGWRGGDLSVSVVADVSIPVEASFETGEHTPAPRLSINAGVPIGEHVLVKAQSEVGYEHGGPWLGFGGALVVGGAKVDGFFDVSGQRRFALDRGGELPPQAPLQVSGPPRDAGTSLFALDEELGFWRWTLGGGIRWRIWPQLQVDARIDYTDVIPDTAGPRGSVSPLLDAPGTSAWVVGAGAAFRFSIFPAG